MNREQEFKPWPELKMAIWRVVMDEKLNDGHYIMARPFTEKLYEAVLAALSAPKAEAETLPCDVQLPGVLLRKGVSMDTLMFALKRREGRPEEDTRFRTSPVPALTDEAVERAVRGWFNSAEWEEGLPDGLADATREDMRRALLAAFPRNGGGE